MIEYMEVMDESCHHYVIPTSRWADWKAWTELDSDEDPAAWVTPDYATPIDGGHLIFPEGWRIGSIE